MPDVPFCCKSLISQEHNAWIHVIATLCVISLGYYHAISFGDWIALVIAMSMVWLAEGMNTAVELLADAVRQEQNTLIGKAKDVAAGAVFRRREELCCCLLVWALLLSSPGPSISVSRLVVEYSAGPTPTCDMPS